MYTNGQIKRGILIVESSKLEPNFMNYSSRTSTSDKIHVRQDEFFLTAEFWLAHIIALGMDYSWNIFSSHIFHLMHIEREKSEKWELVV